MIEQFQSLRWTQIAIMLGAFGVIALFLFLVRRASERQCKQLDSNEPK